MVSSDGKFVIGREVRVKQYLVGIFKKHGDAFTERLAAGFQSGLGVEGGAEFAGLPGKSRRTKYKWERGAPGSVVKVI